MNAKRRLFRTATLLSLIAIVSKVLGFLREASLAAVFGAQHAADAYLVAQTIPQIVFSAFSAALTTTFIPVYARMEHEQGQKAAFRSVSSILNLGGLAAIFFIAAAEVFTEPLMHAVAPGFTGETFALSVSMTRIMLPMVLFQVMLGVFAGMLNSNGDFLVPAGVGLAFNAVVITSIVALGPRFGIQPVAAGTLVALSVQALLQGWAVRRHGYRWSPTLTFSDPGLRQIGRLAVPVLITTGAAQLHTVVERILASGLPEGSIAAFQYATRLQALIPGILGTAITTVMYSTLTHRAAERDWSGFTRSLARSVGLVNFIMLPAAVGLAVLRVPLVRLVFQRGAFDDRATAATAWALLFFGLFVAVSTLRNLVSYALYALQDTRSPMWVSLVTVGVNIALNLALVGSLQQGGLALGAGISYLLALLLLFVALQRGLRTVAGRDATLQVRGIASSLWRVLLGTALLGVACTFTYTRLADLLPGGGTLLQAARLGGAGAAGILAYAGFTLALRVPEAEIVLDALKRGLVSVWRMAPFKKRAR